MPSIWMGAGTILSYVVTCAVHVIIPSLSTSSLHGVDNFLQLVQSRYHPQGTICVPDGTSKAEQNPSASVSISAMQPTVCQFNFHLLQEDMITTYLAGKPQLEGAGSIRTHFKFRNTAQQSSPRPTE